MSICDVVVLSSLLQCLHHPQTEFFERVILVLSPGVSFQSLKKIKVERAQSTSLCHTRVIVKKKYTRKLHIGSGGEGR